MLNVMRENLKTLKPILWVAAISLVLYLGAYFSGSGGSGVSGPWAARVNGEEIPLRQLQLTARNLDQYYRDLFGESYDGLKGQIRIGSQAAERLIADQLILQDAQRLGLRATNAEIAERIRTDPSFTDPATGRFIGAERYKELLNARYDGGPRAYEQVVADEIKRDKWLDLISQTLSVSEAELEQEYRRRTEKTNVDYVLIRSEDRKVNETIRSEDEQAWYAEHQQDYSRGELRSVRYVVIDRQSEAAKLQISDEEVRTSYEANLDNYQHPEQRQARHILFRVAPDADETAKAAARQQAEQALERIRGGEDFAELARTLSEDPTTGPSGGDLGFFGRGTMVPPFETAAFDTPVGELAPLTETTFGFHVIEVTDARAAGATPLEELEDQIRLNLRQQRAAEAVQAQAERLHGILAAAEEFEIAAVAEGFEVQTAEVSRGGSLGTLGASPDLMAAVFAADPGALVEPRTVRSGMALVQVDAVTPPGIAPLEQVLEEVRADILASRAREAALDAALDATEGDFLLADAAKELGLTVQTSGDLPPGAALPGIGGEAPALQDVLFGDDVVIGAKGVAPVPGGAVIYVITDRQPFDREAFEQARADLRGEMIRTQASSLRQALVESLMRRYPVERNDAAIERVNG